MAIVRVVLEERNRPTGGGQSFTAFVVDQLLRAERTDSVKL
jgi:hypothetical protein